MEFTARECNMLFNCLNDTSYDSEAETDEEAAEWEKIRQKLSEGQLSTE